MIKSFLSFFLWSVCDASINVFTFKVGFTKVGLNVGVLLAAIPLHESKRNVCNVLIEPLLS